LRLLRSPRGGDAAAAGGGIEAGAWPAVDHDPALLKEQLRSLQSTWFDPVLF
jgi:hypothetical protein